MRSDNLDGADNQQERLMQIGWVVGYVDGEGCFSIGFVKQPDRVGRRGYSTGYQVVHRFVVTQGARSRSSLEELMEFFDVGRLCENRRQDNHKEHLWQYRVERQRELIETIIPFFRLHPLHTAKRDDFEKFAASMAIVEAGRHTTSAGLLEIVEIAQTMNHRKPRPDLIRILRDHTPNTLFPTG
jgi:LAGLIDADG endonuclease